MKTTCRGLFRDESHCEVRNTLVNGSKLYWDSPHMLSLTDAAIIRSHIDLPFCRPFQAPASPPHPKYNGTMTSTHRPFTKDSTEPCHMGFKVALTMNDILSH